MDARMNAHMCACRCVYAHVCMHMYACMHTFASTHVCNHTCACTHVCRLCVMHAPVCAGGLVVPLVAPSAPFIYQLSRWLLCPNNGTIFSDDKWPRYFYYCNGFRW